jgi:hypothetical protein
MDRPNLAAQHNRLDRSAGTRCQQAGSRGTARRLRQHWRPTPRRYAPCHEEGCSGFGQR